jgi:hypothetical protein
MTKLFIAAVILVPVLAGCKKTGEGEYEVDKPVIGMQKDTIHTPDIDASMKEKQVEVPDIDVKRDTATIKVPDIDINN